jgi:hypothetical protein
MRLLNRSLSFEEDLHSFKKEVTEEISSEEKMLKRIQEPISSENLFHLISCVLMVLMGVLIFLQNSIFYTWMIVGILLYSYNWLIFFVPTTRESIRAEDEDISSQVNKERSWYVIRLLLKERKLAIEMGLTVFLGGILPVALSFTLILGMPLFFAVYFGFFTHFLPGGTATFIVIQISLILLFYVMMLILKPQSQGITKIGRYFRDRIKITMNKGLGPLLVLASIIAALSLVASILVFGAILLPGFLLPVLWRDIDLLAINNLPIIAVVSVSQLVVMRHFQGTVSRIMAEKRIKERLLDMNDVHIKLDRLGPMNQNEDKKVMLDDLKGKYYSIAVYDVFDHDIFGHSRIYLFGVRLRYVLDEDVILYVTSMTKRAAQKAEAEMPRNSTKRRERSGKDLSPELQAEVTTEFKVDQKEKTTMVQDGGDHGNVPSATGTSVPGEPGEPSADNPRKIDLSLIEIASYTLLKAAFENGVDIPIKREGVIDMDVIVNGKELTINTNELYFTVPELAVWHIVYTHRGRPVLEIGRGVKNGLKVHRLNALRLGLETWNGSRKMKREEQT